MKTITVAGGNLYQLAAQYLNDATLWTLIASANNLSDPFFAGIMTLRIPAPIANAGGGPYGNS